MLDESPRSRGSEATSRVPSLADVLPAAATALGVDRSPGAPDDVLTLPEARCVVVMLVDGLGHRLLAERGGHAPFLRRLSGIAGSPSTTGSPTAGGRVLHVGFPSTTATSMGMFGTGLMPGTHGLVGLEVLDPDRGVLFSELGWDPDVDPHRWQPESTVFERVARSGRGVVRIGPGYFDGSGLTEATLRGGRFVGAESFGDRVDAAVAAARSRDVALVYLYWGELDKTGHVYGCDSWQWTQELENVDRHVRDLVERLPPDVLFLLTADHGMVDVPAENRVDLKQDAELSAGIRLVGGEPRALHLYTEAGAADDVAATWRARLGDRADVALRDEAIRGGWFGPVVPRVSARIGDVVVSMRGTYAVFDSRTARPELLRLVGLHGARSPQEVEVPLLATSGQGSPRR